MAAARRLLLQNVIASGKPFAPNTITTDAYYTFDPWQKYVCRTSDGTVHVLLSSTNGMVHFYSRDDGETWTQGDTIWIPTSARTVSIDVDTNDNLVAVRGDSSDSIHFKKATVTKNATWTWSWGDDVEVNSSITCYYPDIVADGNNYYHIVYYDTMGNPQWERSIDGGETWTRTDLGGFAGGIGTGIIKDENNNLYIFSNIGADYLKAVKITYSAGPSWSVGTYYNVSHITDIAVESFHILSNGKLVVTYCNGTTGELFFRKSTNAYDLSAWDTQVEIATLDSGELSNQFGSIMVISNTQIRVYYCSIEYFLCYKESTDGGVTFGAEQTVWSTGENMNVNVAKEAYNSKIDYVWYALDLSIVYHYYYS